MAMKHIEERLNRKHLLVTDYFNLYYPSNITTKNSTWNIIVDPNKQLDLAIVSRYFMHVNDFNTLNLKQVYFNPNTVSKNQYIILNHLVSMPSSDYEIIFYHKLSTLHVMPKTQTTKPFKMLEYNELCRQIHCEFCYDRNPNLSDAKHFEYVMQILIHSPMYVTEDLYDMIESKIERYKLFRHVKTSHYNETSIDYSLKQPTYYTANGFDTIIYLQ